MKRAADGVPETDPTRSANRREPTPAAADPPPRYRGYDLEPGCHSSHATPRNDRRRPLWAVANWVRERVVTFEGDLRGRIRHVHGPANVECGPDDMVVVCLGRDTALWIEGHIEHHLELGARHVFYLDNASRDDAVEAASRYDRVSVFTTDISFNRYEVGLRRWLTKRFGRNRWCLATDADELWDYPMSDRLRLPGFLRYLRHYGYKAVTGHMLDLFSDRPFSQLDSRPGDPLRENYRFYDLSDLAETRDVYWIRDGLLATDAFGCIFGGVRKRFFGDADLCLTKHPLVFADDTVGVYTYDVHFMTGAPVADVSTVLLHYKYVSSLPDRSRAAMVDNWFKESASLYAGLNRVLTDQPDLCLRLSSSRELDDVQELVDCGFLNVSPQYRDWIERYGDG